VSEAIGDKDRIVRTGDLLTSKVDDEIVAMSVANGAVYGFDVVTAELWNRLETPCTLEDLCAALMQLYEVDAAECRDAVVDVLNVLRADGLVAIAR
jgi:hypothetical protein